MNANSFAVDIHMMGGVSAVKARADVRIRFDSGTLTLFGLSVIEKDGKPPWVAFPSKQGKNPGKYFPVVEADGEIRKRIADVVLEGYQVAKAA